MSYLLPASGSTTLPLDLEQVKMAARGRAQNGVSRELLKQAMVNMARDRGPSDLATYNSLVAGGLLGAESMDKEAIAGALLGGGKSLMGLLGLGGRGAARNVVRAAGGARPGRVGQWLAARGQRRAAKNVVRRAQRAPGTGLAPAKAPTAPSAVAPAGGPYRTPGTVSATKTTPAGKDLVEEVATEGKQGPGLVSGMLRRVALPAAVVGGGYLAYKGGKGLVGVAERAAYNPPAYGHGLRQYRYGFTPGGQAQF